MQLINHPFTSNVPPGTLAHDSLRLYLQGADFQDREWADNALFDTFVRRFDLILAIVDTRCAEAGFVCYYKKGVGEVLMNPCASLPLPDLPIIRLAATGNHFLSVRSHPELMQGTLTKPFNFVCDFNSKVL